MTHLQSLSALRKEWEATQAALIKNPNATDANAACLHSLLQRCVAAGADYEGTADRISLQLLARDIADATFRLTREYPDASVRPSALSQATTPVRQQRIDVTSLLAGTADFLGRDAELGLLDAAWADKRAGTGRVQVVELIAPGGTGKTALVKRWLDGLQADSWRGAERVYGWTFGSQGTENDRQVSDDPFLSGVLGWLGVEDDPARSSWDKGKRLAGTMAAARTLLFLDGLEPLQHPPGPLAGQLRAPGVKALLVQLASGGHPGLCVVTSRECIRDLDEYVRGDDRPAGSVVRHNLGSLSDTDGARLLHRLGVCYAGAVTIEDEDLELQTASREVQGHALTLSLLGRYLARAHGGDIRQRDKVALEDADAALGGLAVHVMVGYERSLEREGEQGARELAALRLLGYFDRPADAGCLAALREPPPIPGLTEPLVDLSAAEWKLILSRLKDCGLTEPIQAEPRSPAADPPSIDAHPLVREYLAKTLRDDRPEAWREGHRRLYEHLKSSVPDCPEGLRGLEPLYQAMAHGCLAGLQQEACKIYRDRILRGTGENGYYSTRKLGAFGTDLGALACFFGEPWRRVSTALSVKDQAWLLNQVAFCLRAQGRLSEALEPVQAGLKGAIEGKDWESAAIRANDLSELELTLGRVADAVLDSERSVQFADRSDDGSWQMISRTTRADALHHQGEWERALTCFQEAEAMQVELKPDHPLLWSVRGFHYCDRLLAQPERAAWQEQLGARKDRAREITACKEIEARARQTFGIVESKEWRLAMALDRLTLSRAALIRAVLDSSGPGSTHPDLDQARQELDAAVKGLKEAGRWDYAPLGLLPRAWLRALQNDPTTSRADLDEAWQIASRGDMRLFMADIHLHRARLFHDRQELAKARTLVEECGYGRRLDELEDAEANAPAWSDTQ